MQLDECPGKTPGRERLFASGWLGPVGQVIFFLCRQAGRAWARPADNATPTREAILSTGWTTLGTGASAYYSLVRTASAQSFTSAGSNSAGQLGDGTFANAPRFNCPGPLTSLQ